MSETLRLVLAFLVACGATLLLTPLAIALAHRTRFYDRPVGYKGHLHPTPYLGGAAVVSGLLISGALFGHAAGGFLSIALGALALLGLGTLDDRLGLGPLVRVLVQVAAAGGLFAAGIGWSIFSYDALNLAFSLLFVTGVVNAYNLMDNLDGAASVVAASSGAGLGALAATEGSAELGAIALALSGACVGFLRFNLASPARIFLGDGGSTPIGFVVAAVVMALPGEASLGWVLVPVTVVLVGLPALDTTLVVVSRVRRGVAVFTGARDHLTHRLCSKLGSVRRVALVLATGQAIVGGVGAVLWGADRSVALAGSVLLILLGIGGVVVLESPEWAPTANQSST